MSISRPRSASPGPPLHHGVVGPDVDGPVVGEECVRDRRQPLEGILVAVGDGLIREVAAGQHDRAAGRFEQQLVQRGIRQHDAKRPVPRRDRRRNRAGAPRQQHDRPPRAGQQRGGGPVQLAKFGRRRQAGRHHREWLVLPVLARPQRGGRLLAARVHGEVVAAEPLHRQHLPVPQQRGRRRQRVAGLQQAAVGRTQAQPGPAGGAADRLRMEPAVRRVVVLRRTRLAHGEGGHRCVGPVVGHVSHDGEPRPAVGAVDERVRIPPVRGIAELGQAAGAHGAVGRHQGGPLGPRCARRNREPRTAVWPQVCGHDLVDPRQRRGITFHRGQELRHRGGGPFDLREHALGVVADETGQAKPRRQRVDERAEADPLHRPGDPHRYPGQLSVHRPSVARPCPKLPDDDQELARPHRSLRVSPAASAVRCTASPCSAKRPWASSPARRWRPSAEDKWT